MCREKVLYAYQKGYRVSRKGDILNPNGKKIKGTLQSGGGHRKSAYKRISFRMDGKRTYIKAHKLAAYQKFGEKSFDKDLVVRHLNDISTDNSWGNLEMGSQKENMLDKIRNGKFGTNGDNYSRCE